MPLLNKKPFAQNTPPHNLRETDKVFYCEITNEVFTDYEEYWARLVLCNAMVWTCEITGRPNLTYAEAIESENKAQRCLSNVPNELRKPMLYIASLTRRGRYVDVSDDVFNFVRDRYFVGEEVEAIVKNHWYDCKVLKIIYPTEEEIARYEEKMAESDEEEEEGSEDGIEVLEVKTPEKAAKVPDDDDDIEIVKVVHKDGKSSPPKEGKSSPPKDAKKKDEDDYPPFATFKYEVIELDPWDGKERKKYIVTWEQIRRNKGILTREKCKMFLKQAVQLSPRGFWCVKERVSRKYSLSEVKYEDIFPGNPPKFQETISKKMPAGLSPHHNQKKKEDNMEQKKREREEKTRQRKEARDKNAHGEVSKKKSSKQPISVEDKEQRKKMLMDEKEQRKKLMKEQKEEKREELKLKIEKVKEERKREKELKKEMKRLQTEFIKEWKRPRDDLECDDHKDLPRPTPVQCRIPDEMFSEFIMVLEFINVFAELLELKDVYPQGITFDMLEHALVEKEVAGVLNDVFQLLLQAVFTLQEEEDDEVEADNTAEEVMETDTCDISIQEAVRLANRAATWSQQYYGVPLQKVPLDALTLTEVLRLHLLASGATNVANAQWRHFNRGGYKNYDDPGLLFKLEEPEILRSLSNQTVFDIPLVSKLKILNVLIGQILTYASARDIIDDNIEKLKEMKNKLRLHQYTQSRKEKEFLAARQQEKREKRQKEMERRVREAEKKASALAMTGESDKPIELDLDEEEEEEEEEDEDERAAREEKEEKNKEARKQDFLKREQELLQQVLNIAKGACIAPLGQDRAYRRYWMFNSLPGLFVEDNEPNRGLCCLAPTPHNPDSSPDLAEALQDLFKIQAEKNLKVLSGDKDEKSNSDKENDNVNSPTKINKNALNKKLLQTPNDNKGAADSDLKMNADAQKQMNGTVTDAEIDDQNSQEDSLTDLMDLGDPITVESLKKMNDCVDGNGKDKNHKTEEDREYLSRIFGLCTADPQTCTVHSDSVERHKWFFYHNMEDLHTLIDSLNGRGYREKELKSTVENYRPTIESSMRACPVYKLDPSQDPELDKMSRKSQRNLTSKKDGDPNLNFPPGTPIDEILQLTLRDMILETEEKIYLGMLGSLRTDNREMWRKALEEGSYFKEGELDHGGRKRIAQFKNELGLEVSEDADTEDLLEEETEAGAVKDLAQAILQIGQSIDSKYLTTPLGENEKSRKRRERMEEKLRRKAKEASKGSGDEGSNHESEEEEEEEEEGKNNSPAHVSDNALRTPMERWERSLMASTNLSQLCLHYATLDNSITWSRSALNARCRICRRKADAENMLLCDGCDKGYHIYCLKPKLRSVPSGDWYCDKCKPKEKPKSPRKKNRHLYKEESDDENGVEDSEEEEIKEENENKCYECGKSGTLICCDTCPFSFHQNCANLRKIPRGSWSCHHCQDSTSKDKKESPSDKKKKKEKNKENHNKENKKSPKGNNNSKKEKKSNAKESANNRRSTSAEKRRRSDGDTNGQNAKKQRLREMESENTPPKRSRRSLVDEGCELNSPALETVLEELLKHQSSWPFNKPVSKKDAPDYYDIVKKPMDFRTIQSKLYDMKYLKDEEFIADVMLVFQNCQQYNMENTDEYKAGLVMSKYFLKRIKELGFSYQGEKKPPQKKRKV